MTSISKPFAKNANNTEKNLKVIVNPRMSNNVGNSLKSKAKQICLIVMIIPKKGLYIFPQLNKPCLFYKK